MASLLLYAFGLIAAVAALAFIRPIARLYLGTRRRAFRAGLAAMVGIIATLAWPAHDRTVASPVSHLDAIVPVSQFSEFHETTIDAPAGRIYQTICAVTANEIALLRTLTWIRRLGRSAPESVLNPPGDRAFCDVALKSGFYMLADDPPHEIVLGTFAAAPKATRARPRADISAATFQGIRAPGFAIAVLNFRLFPLSPSRTRLTTETRVFATDARTRRLFAAYWRVIYPGSSLIRMTWLRAIKRRAEAGYSRARK